MATVWQQHGTVILLIVHLGADLTLNLV